MGRTKILNSLQLYLTGLPLKGSEACCSYNRGDSHAESISHQHLFPPHTYNLAKYVKKKKKRMFEGIYGINTLDVIKKKFF